mgnify:CR=1 FL=1|tara:strand:+ start:141 stop:536 length:396 start_codon:yes stop_codon:yes gene_type:complete
MEIEESNKLIAEFLGMQKTDIGWFDNEGSLSQYIYDETGGNCHDYLLFDKDWNWIIPVVEKIESLKINGKYFIPYIDIRGSNCTIYKKVRHGLPEPWFRASDITPSGNKIQGVYITILEFIKWYNDQEESI